MFGLLKGVMASQGGVPFAFGNALLFAVNDRVDLDSTITLTGDYTISAWYKRTSISQDIIMSGTTNDGYAMFFNNNTDVRVRTTSGSSSLNFALPATMSTGTWYNVVLVRSGSNVSYYQNDTASSSNPLTTTLEDMTIERFGVRQNLTLPLDGTLDEIGIADVAATSGQLTSLFNGGSGNDFSTVMGSGNTVGHYKLNESGTDTAAVDSALANNGTLVNFPASGMWVSH